MFACGAHRTVDDPSFWHRLQFGFTIVYHYLFPQLTMGLAFMIVLWKWQALRTLMSVTIARHAFGPRSSV